MRPSHEFKLCGGGGEHVFGRDNRDDASSRRILDFNGSAHDHHIMTERKRRLGQRLAHATAGGVREITHRVDKLTSGAGGDEDSGQGLTTETRGHGEEFSMNANNR